MPPWARSVGAEPLVATVILLARAVKIAVVVERRSPTYGPKRCKRDYRVVVLRKNISVERGENAWFEE
jgi:hypothetical protein